MNFKLSVFVALVICTLLVTAAPPPAQDAQKSTAGSEDTEEILAFCTYMCGSQPMKKRKSCAETCQKRELERNKQKQ